MEFHPDNDNGSVRLQILAEQQLRNIILLRAGTDLLTVVSSRGVGGRGMMMRSIEQICFTSGFGSGCSVNSICMQSVCDKLIM